MRRSRRPRTRRRRSPPPEIADAISTSPQGGGWAPCLRRCSVRKARLPQAVTRRRTRDRTRKRRNTLRTSAPWARAAVIEFSRIRTYERPRPRGHRWSRWDFGCGPQAQRPRFARLAGPDVGFGRPRQSGCAIALMTLAILFASPAVKSNGNPCTLIVRSARIGIGKILTDAAGASIGWSGRRAGSCRGAIDTSAVRERSVPLRRPED